MLKRKPLSKKRYAVGFTLFVFLMTLMRFTLQDFMLYYPDSHTPSSEMLSAQHLRYWPSGAAGYRGFAGTIPAAPEKGTIVVFHGNAGSAADRAYYVKALAPLGFRIILAEYPGYGARKGKLGEKPFVNDARETLKIVVEKYGGPVFLVGESLGAGVAASVLKGAPVPIEGIVLITPWASLLAVAREKFPWLPVRLFLPDAYDTAENLKFYNGKVAVIRAEQDEIIAPIHSIALYESLEGVKRIWTVRGAGHNDWPEIVDESIWKDVAGFLAGNDNE